MTLNTEAPTEATPEAAPEPERSRTQVRFTGSGAEYFRIWAVNLTLTILTLGLYGPWAKVRRLQYFHRNTELDGAVFDYTASPLGILLGRVIALVLLVVYYLAYQFSQYAVAAVTVLLIAVLPYLLWQSNRFKARNTRYRGLSFRFAGTVRNAYRVYLPALVVAFGPSVVVALWLDPRAQSWSIGLSLIGFLALPVLHAMYRRYVQANLHYGDTPFEFTAKGSDFVAVWMWGLGVMIAGALAMAMGGFLIGGLAAVIAGKGHLASAVLFLSILLPLWLSYILIGSYFTARFQRLVWEKTRVGDLGLTCEISATRLLAIQAFNTVAVILSLGVFRPFAAIRVARYRLQSMFVHNVESLAGVNARADAGRTGATGEGAAELFEMDVGL